MSAWDAYPPDYRAAEVQIITAAVRAGECVSIVGLSGAGKSNLLGYLAHRPPTPEVQFVFVDCNRLVEHRPAALFRLMRRALDPRTRPRPLSPSRSASGNSGATGEGETDELAALDAAIQRRWDDVNGSEHALTFLLDLSLLLDRSGRLFGGGEADRAWFSNLRALRDAHKFRLVYVAATRHPLPPHTELAELFYAHTIWLGPLNDGDARWNVRRYAARRGLAWDDSVAGELVAVSGRYPSLLRAVCEAYSDGVKPDADGLGAHPAVRARVEEFWADNPTEDELRRSGLQALALLMAGRAPSFDTAHLTAKEHLLLRYFRTHADEVCEKDDLIRAVWPEDRVFERGVRDDSLAQLVRRLREKIEPDPAHPRYIHTVPGRGYRFTVS